MGRRAPGRRHRCRRGQVTRLYTAAANCLLVGRPDDAVGYAQRAQTLDADPRYDSFDPAWARFCEANAHRIAGRIDRCLESGADLAAHTNGLALVSGLGTMLYLLPAVGRADEAIAIAGDAVAAARAYANPVRVAYALAGYGRADFQADPTRALTALREGLGCSREHRVPLMEAVIARDLAVLEAVHGDLGEAVTLFEAAVDAFQRAGNIANVAATLACVAVCMDRLDRHEVAATIYGATYSSYVASVVNLQGAVDHLRAELGDTAFDRCVATGAAVDLTHAAAYVRAQLRLARNELGTRS